jgi:hypothetical protein
MVDQDPKRPSLLQVLFSTLAAFIGVQSDKNRQKDFQQSSIVPFMITGIVLAGLFIFGLIFIARQITP